MFLGGEYTSFPAKEFASSWNTLIPKTDLLNKIQRQIQATVRSQLRCVTW